MDLNVSESETHIVFCVGVSRAGSTLQYNLTRTLLERLGVGSGLHFLNTEDDLRNASQQAKCKGLITAIKTYQYDFAWLDSSDLKVSKLGIYRDLRDVYSSRKKKKGERIDEFIAQTRNDLESLNRLSASGRILFQRYEDVILDLAKATREIAAFLNLEAGEDDVLYVAEQNTIEAALREIKSSFGRTELLVSRLNKLFKKQSPITKGFLRAIGVIRLVRLFVPSGNILSPHSKLHPDHISPTRGMPGKWRQELSAIEAQMITNAFSDWLEKHGYL